MALDLTLDYPTFSNKQRDIFNGLMTHKLVALKGGRRGMKTFTQIWFMIEKLLEGKKILYALPAPEGLGEVFHEVCLALYPIKKILNIHRSSRIISYPKLGGHIHFKTLQRGGVGRGFNYDVVIIDEAQECETCAVDLKSIIQDSILPTFLITNGTLVLSGTGRARCFFTQKFNEWGTNPEAYTHRWSSYESPFINEEALKRMMEEMDNVAIRQEIFAEDIERGSTLFQQANLKTVSKEDIPKLDHIVLACDLAISKKTSADYTVLLVMGKHVETNTYYVLHVFRDRISFNDTLKSIKNICEQWGIQHVVVEAVAYQKSMAEELQRTSALSVVTVYPETDKYTRAIPVNALAERGQFLISDEVDKNYIRELLTFPLPKNHDDQVDATVYGFRTLRKLQ